MGTSRTRDQRNRNQKHIRNLRKTETSQSPKYAFENNWKDCKTSMVVKNRRGNYQRKQNCFPKIDNFWKELMRQKIYSFYLNKIVPTRYTLE